MPFPRHCPNCGALVDESATFCYKCGSALTPQQPATPGPFQPIPSSEDTRYPRRYEQPFDLSQRLERASRRIELLVYVVIGLSVIILFESIYLSGFFG